MLKLTEKETEQIQQILHRRNQVEIKVENSKIVVIEVKRKKVN